MTSLPQHLYTPSQVRELDRIAIEQEGIPSIVLMKRAGRAAFQLLQERWPDTTTLHVFCGGGNNGGDGYVVAALAKQSGLSAKVWQFSEGLTEAAEQACAYAQQENAMLQPFSLEAFAASLAEDESDTTILVDALLGTGFQGALKPAYQQGIEAINRSACNVLALDIPSGVYGDSGWLETIAVKADATISFIAQKVGNYTGPGLAYTGDCYLDDLQVPPSIYESLSKTAIEVLQTKDLLAHLLPRQRDAHKGDCGHVLVVGGDEGYGGAAIMAAEMAARSGAGLVGVATRPEHCSAIITRQPELMAKPVNSGQALSPLLSAPDVLVVGPGLGRSAWSEQLLERALREDKPLVLDADALNMIAEGFVLPELSTRQWLMTPHPGEAARLLNCSIADIQRDRIQAAKTLQERFNSVVILKGAGTVIASQHQIKLAAVGNPGMASGGMGDVLSGLVGSLLAQGLSLELAAYLGVCLHGDAADLGLKSWGERGLLATDLIPVVAQILSGR